MIATAETRSIRDMARDAVESTDTIEDAIAALVVASGEAGPLARLGARTAIHEIRHAARTEIKRMPDPCSRGAAAIASIAPVAEQTILDTWRCGDVRLGDMTGSDLDAEIAVEREKEQGHRKNAVFYQMLRRRVGDGDTVRSKVKPDAAAKMLNAATGRQDTEPIPFPEPSRSGRRAGPSA